MRKKGQDFYTEYGIVNRLELGEQNANQVNKKDTVVSLQSASGEKIDDEYILV
jgi:hypothetical protein